MSFAYGSPVLSFFLSSLYTKSSCISTFTFAKTSLKSSLISNDGNAYSDGMNDGKSTEGSSPSLIFLNMFKESLLDGTFLKLTLADPSDEFNHVSSSVSGRVLKGKKSLQFSFMKGKNVYSSKNFDFDEGTRFVQDLLHKPIRDSDADSNQEEEDSNDARISGFKLATLETERTEVQLKLKKGLGKLKKNDKETNHLDTDFILNQKMVGDPKSIRKILEDRRLLLLTDPKNQRLKQLYAEAKRAVDLL